MSKSIFQLFTLQGNIGSGKTTLLKLLQQKSNIDSIKILFQPVDQWQNIGQQKTNILKLFYQDPSKWAFPFQLFTLVTRFKKCKRAKLTDHSKLYISQRSSDADYHVFKKYMYQHKFIDKDQSQVYQQFYKSYLETMDVTPSKGVIYLRTSPQNCMIRLKKRCRSQQTGVPLEYLQALHQLHDQMIQTLRKQGKPVIIIDGNQNFVEDDEIKIKCVEQMKKFVQRI